MIDNDKPTPDVIEQQRPARPDAAEDEPILPGAMADIAFEADPADVAEQQRTASVLDDDEPGPDRSGGSASPRAASR